MNILDNLTRLFYFFTSSPTLCSKWNELWVIFYFLLLPIDAFLKRNYFSFLGHFQSNNGSSNISFQLSLSSINRFHFFPAILLMLSSQPFGCLTTLLLLVLGFKCVYLLFVLYTPPSSIFVKLCSPKCPVFL